VIELSTKGAGCKINTLCELFGRSRQAYYQHSKYNYKQEVKQEILVQLVEKQRKIMPRIGGRKLLQLIQPGLPEELYLGRDAFFDFLRDNVLLIRKRRYRARTTYSNHWLHKYPNLVKYFTPERAHQLWVSDITYIETGEGFGYLSLVTDAYSRKIIGWELGPTLEAKYSVMALEEALNQLPKGESNVFHHSDRGIQYCCDEYVKLLTKNHFQISMTETGDPRDNAIAERVNGILKDEWLNQMKLETIAEAARQLEQIITIYNHNRPHSSLDMNTPAFAHNQNGEFKKHWKTYHKREMTEQSSNLEAGFYEAYDQQHIEKQTQPVMTA
jgi:putative transposase